MGQADMQATRGYMVRFAKAIESANNTAHEPVTYTGGSTRHISLEEDEITASVKYIGDRIEDILIIGETPIGSREIGEGSTNTNHYIGIEQCLTDDDILDVADDP